MEMDELRDREESREGSGKKREAEAEEDGQLEGSGKKSRCQGERWEGGRRRVRVRSGSPGREAWNWRVRALRPP